MDLASVRIITDELDRTVEFYEEITGVRADHHALGQPLDDVP